MFSLTGKVIPPLNTERTLELTNLHVYVVLN